jgi:hypothetical protein
MIRSDCQPPAGRSEAVVSATRRAMVETTIRPGWALAAALVAVAFGIVTIVVGGRTLFGGPSVAAAAENIIPFVLWFNFIAGFAYVAAGVGLFLWKPWAAQLSALVALATIAVFFALGMLILLGGAFEMRTVGAMSIRSLVWIVIALAACRALRCFGYEGRTDQRT